MNHHQPTGPGQILVRGTDLLFQFQLGENPGVVAVKITPLGAHLPASGGDQDHPMCQAPFQPLPLDFLAYSGAETPHRSLHGHQFSPGENFDVGMPKNPGFQFLD